MIINSIIFTSKTYRKSSRANVRVTPLVSTKLTRTMSNLSTTHIPLSYICQTCLNFLLQNLVSMFCWSAKFEVHMLTHLRETKKRNFHVASELSSTYVNAMLDSKDRGYNALGLKKHSYMIHHVSITCKTIKVFEFYSTQCIHFCSLECLHALGAGHHIVSRPTGWSSLVGSRLPTLWPLSWINSDEIYGGAFQSFCRCLRCGSMVCYVRCMVPRWCYLRR